MREITYKCDACDYQINEVLRKGLLEAQYLFPLYSKEVCRECLMKAEEILSLQPDDGTLHATVCDVCEVDEKCDNGMPHIKRGTYDSVTQISKNLMSG